MSPREGLGGSSETSGNIKPPEYQPGEFSLGEAGGNGIVSGEPVPKELNSSTQLRAVSSPGTDSDTPIEKTSESVDGSAGRWWDDAGGDTSGGWKSELSATDDAEVALGSAFP